MGNHGLQSTIGTLCLLVVSVLAGCQSTSGEQSHPVAFDEATCPDAMQDQVRVAGSAVPLAIPEELTQGSVDHHGQIARRVTMSVAPKSGARDAKVFSSTLTMTTVGGVLAGWAAIDRGQERSQALDVIPGRLRIEPFLSSRSLQARTMVVDVLVKPGSTPLDELAITAAALWNGEQRPVRPEDLRLAFAPVRHMTVFDVVDAKLTLDVTATSAHGLWHCSFENRFELIDRASVLPDLWGLRKTGHHGEEDEWLALSNPTTGPFRAVFTNPLAAQGFADWLRATRSTQVDQHSLGLFQLEAPESNTPPAANHTVAVPFHKILQEDIQALDVKRLGE